MLVGEYLSKKGERPSFYLRNRIHIAELTSEGSDT